MKIAIVGLGVIGGSFAMALKKAGYDEVYGIDIDESTITKAKSIGIIKDGCTKGNEILKEADLVIVSIYPKLIKNLFWKINQILKKELL